MNIVFAIIAAVTIAAAVAAMSLRNLVHCALALAVAFAGIAAAYLQLGAQFVGFTQLLVYVGAVAILVVFAILLTRGSGTAAAIRFVPGLDNRSHRNGRGSRCPRIRDLAEKVPLFITGRLSPAANPPLPSAKSVTR